MKIGFSLLYIIGLSDFRSDTIYWNHRQRNILRCLK